MVAPTLYENRRCSARRRHPVNLPIGVDLRLLFFAGFGDCSAFDLLHLRDILAMHREHGSLLRLSQMNDMWTDGQAADVYAIPARRGRWNFSHDSPFLRGAPFDAPAKFSPQQIGLKTHCNYNKYTIPFQQTKATSFFAISTS
jgi:hypothetical protein